MKLEKNRNGNFTSDNGKVTTNNLHSVQTSQLQELFENHLKDIYWAEKALASVFPKMIKNATSIALVDALTHHFQQTTKQVERLEQVFEHISKKAVAKKCPAMEGLITEAVEIMEVCEVGPMRDLGIIAAAQKIEHYEMASYTTLHQYAQALDMSHAVEILETTLDEEIACEEKLSELAMRMINMVQTPVKIK